MTPTTLPGFLVFAGLALFVISFFSGTISIKDLKLRLPSPDSREVLRWVGVILFCGGIGLFAYYEGWFSGASGGSHSPARKAPVMQKQP